MSMNDQKNLYFREKNLYEYGQYKKKSLAFQQKICILPNFRGKICILQNSRVKKSVYTDKTCMSGRSAICVRNSEQFVVEVSVA